MAEQNNIVCPTLLWVTKLFKLFLPAFRAIHQMRNLWMERFLSREENWKETLESERHFPQAKLTFSLFIVIYYHCSDLGHSCSSNLVAFDLLH